MVFVWLRKRISFGLFRLGWYILCVVRFFIGLIQPDRSANLPPIHSEILRLTAAQIADRVRTGQLTCKEIARAYLERIHEVDSICNSYCEVNPNLIIEAGALDLEIREELNGNFPPNLIRKPLLGVPISVKNSIAVRGLLQDCGIPYYRGNHSKRDSKAIENLRRAGALILGITNVPESLNWYETKNWTYGITRNPYGLTRIVGGSSGGEGAALGSACSVLGLGSDMMGSIRMPAHCCGIFGHKPTNGTIVSQDGLIPPYSPKLAPIFTLGPMSRFATDLRLAMSCLAEPEELKKLELESPVDLSKLKYFYTDDNSPHPTISPVSEEVRSAMAKARAHMEKKFGIKFRKIVLSKLKLTDSLWLAGIKEYDPVTQMDHMFGTDRSKHPNLYWEIAKSYFRLSENCTEALWVAAFENYAAKPHLREKFRKIRLDFRDQVRRIIGTNGVLFSITLPIEAPKHFTTLYAPADVGYAGVFNILELPVTHVPMGLSKNGLPIGFGVAATPYMDRNCLAVAEELERAFGGWTDPSCNELNANVKGS